MQEKIAEVFISCKSIDNIFMNTYAQLTGFRIHLP